MVSWCQHRDWNYFMAPPKKDTEAINLRLPRELIAALDDRRRIEPDLPTRPEMIRRALIQWLEMTEKTL
ncbi:ribbon-helix-helix protein, CopG family [Rhodobacter sp. CZR27]|uniref:ribbon-helix-helix protein, CopG family n=1 Tax=Rhodobacter sp. CZR27 TaxID=2033869 RepID=UPI002FC5C1F0